MWWRQDPGPCPVCGAAHAACKALSSQAQDPITVVQLPARDARAAAAVPATQPPAPAETTFTTATYRRPKGRH
jgi:hypothetical protein